MTSETRTATVPRSATDADGPRNAVNARWVAVWDVPTRLFHWLLVALVVVNVYTGNVGGLREMDLHMLSGYAILTLVLFRVAWGFLGSGPSRFRGFVRGPGAVLAYARGLLTGRHRPTIGHNPLGGWSVMAMLTSLLLQAGTGLFANDDILTEGPLARSVSKATSDRLTAIHDWNATVLYVLIGAHLAAVLYYLLVRKENLVRPMLTGRKLVTGDAAPADLRAGAGGLTAALVLAVAAGGVWWLVR